MCLKQPQIIGATWLIGKSGASYATDPGSNLSDAQFLSIKVKIRFFVLCLSYGAVGWETIAGRLSGLEATQVKETLWILP